MFLNGTGEDYLFQVFPFIDKIGNRIFMGNADNILFDNRSGIQFGRYIMAGGANDLNTPFKSGMIRFRTNKCRQERMMDIDNTIRIGFDHLFGYNVPGQ